MATSVTSLTADRIMELVNALIESGEVDEDGNIILTQHDGTQHTIGQIPVSVSPGELSAILEDYALSTEVTSAISSALSSYVTSSSLSSTLASYALTSAVTSAISSALSSYSNTTAMNSAISSAISSALASYVSSSTYTSGTNGLVASSTINSSRVLVHTKKDGSTANVGQVPANYLYSSGAYAISQGNTYIGNTAPSPVADGSVWFDTT